MILMFLFYSFMVVNLPTLADFDKATDIEEWKVVDDVVMGGRSNGHFHYDQEGYAIFTGHISLANNGGFSSVQYEFEPVEVDAYGSIIIRLKGDGSTYQFRVKSKTGQRYWYVQEFKTNGKWQELELRFSDFEPRYRGDILDRPNYSGNKLAATAFLIANGLDQDFSLKIDKISVQ